MQKLLSWLAAISTGIGCLVILIGVISGMFRGKSIVPAIQAFVDYWTIANSFFIVAILIVVYKIRLENKTG